MQDVEDAAFFSSGGKRTERGLRLKVVPGSVVGSEKFQQLLWIILSFFVTVHDKAAADHIMTPDQTTDTTQCDLLASGKT